MRFLLFSKADLYGNINLNQLLGALCPEHEVQVCLSDLVMPEERGFPAADFYLHRSRDFLLDTFFPAVDARDFADGHGDLLTFSGLSRRYGTEVVELGADPREARRRTRELAAAFRPDIILCCRHDYILPLDVFAPASVGSFNLHSGRAPDYRGPFCSFWTMLRQEEFGCCTLHMLEEKIDAGDIVGVARVRMDYAASLMQNLMTIYAAGIDSFLRLLPLVCSDSLTRQPQSPDRGTYFRQPNVQDVDSFLAAGRRLVDDGEYSLILERYLPTDVSLGFMPALRKGGERWQISPPA